MSARVYRIVFAPRAERDFRSLDRNVQRRLRPRIDALAWEPRPRGAEMLKGERSLLQIRVGAYCVVYHLEPRRPVVLVLKIGHRRAVYWGI